MEQRRFKSPFTSRGVNVEMKSIKIAASSMLSQGESPFEQFNYLKNIGFEGVEFRLKIINHKEKLGEYLEKVTEAVEETGLYMCSLLTPDFTFSLPFNSIENANKKLESLATNIKIASKFGAISIFCPEYLPQSPLPLWDPFIPFNKKEKQLLVDLLLQAAEIAEKENGQVAIEALNRYETHLIRNLNSALEICEVIGSPRVGILADFFHMNIEESDISRSIQSARNRIIHVQLGDSNRLLPGQGHIDFKSGIKALIDIDYNGFMAFECLSPEPKIKNLKGSIAFLKKQFI